LLLVQFESRAIISSFTGYKRAVHQHLIFPVFFCIDAHEKYEIALNKMDKRIKHTFVIVTDFNCNSFLIPIELYDH
jgi:hypothetical protein